MARVFLQYFAQLPDIVYIDCVVVIARSHPILTEFKTADLATGLLDPANRGLSSQIMQLNIVILRPRHKYVLVKPFHHPDTCGMRARFYLLDSLVR